MSEGVVVEARNETPYQADVRASRIVSDFQTTKTGLAIARVLGRQSPPERDSWLRDLEAANLEISRLFRVLDAYQAALDRHAILAVTDRAGRIVHVNSMLCATTGYSESELLGKSFRLVNSGHHPKEFFADLWRTVSRGEVWHGEICNRAKNGALYWVDTTIVPLVGQKNRIEAYVSVRYEITKRKAAEAALLEEVERRRKAETLLVDVIETVPDGIAAFDPDDRLVLFNQAYKQCFPLSKEAIHIGSEFSAILEAGLKRGEYQLPKNTAEAREAWLRSRIKAHRKPGRKLVQALSDGRWIQIQESRSASGHIVGTRTDITELKRSEAAIKYHAEHDPLTGLLNRSVLGTRLSEAVSGAVRSGQKGALLVLDLDGFKAVNDTMGHSAGDALLVAVAERLTGVLRRSDTVVRLGGDEFAIILPNVFDIETVSRVAEKLLVAIQQPLTIQRRAITPNMSIGISLFPRDGRKAEILLKNADIALYQAKDFGKSTYRVYSRAMRSGIEERRKKADALSAAVATDRIDVAFQPQFSLKDSSHIGFEALARWRHNGADVAPSDFIAIAEETGLIVDLGWRVLRKSLETIRSLRWRRVAAGTVAVNIAAAQLKIAEFPSLVRQMLEEHGLLPRDIEIELTENILLHKDGGRISEALQTFRAMGFSIALDDFGTGYASLSHLSRFPVDRLKIDRSFVRDMCDDAAACTIVKATIGLAHSLDMTVVAEGIETEDQLAGLRSCECDFGQGYLVSKPLDAACLPAFLGTAART
jgi:diguanylate cyclase (GGDEF)-like protein/PAS domain S-box-containing protein